MLAQAARNRRSRGLSCRDGWLEACPTAATASCATAMARRRAIQTGVGACRGPPGRRCATARRGQPMASESASPRRSCRSGRGARRASTRCCRCSACGASRRATSRRRSRHSWARTRQNLSPAVISRTDGGVAGRSTTRWQKRDLSARRYVYVWADGCLFPAGPMVDEARMHAGADRRDARGQEGTRRLPDRGT